MNDCRILYSSSAIYLTFLQFKALIPELMGFTHILLNIKEKYSKFFDDKFILEKNVTQIFDLYIKLKKEIRLESLNNFRKYKKKIFEYLYKINPNAIISGSDLSGSDRILFLWCRRNKIPFIIIQPSFISAFPAKYGLVRNFKYIIVNRIFNLPVYQKQDIFGNESQKSHLFLWGEYFISNPKRKNCYILGNPAFDKLFKSFSPERKIKNSILICTDNLPAHIVGEKYLKLVNQTFQKAFGSKPEILFYFKVHPRESIEKYKKLFPKDKFLNVEIIKDRDIYELINLSDIQISVASYTSFEAAAMGVPIITIRPDENINVFDQFKREIDIRVNNPDEIVDAINLCLSDKYWDDFVKKREKYFKSRLYSTDCQSSRRVASTIKKLIRKKCI
ncbi:MAG: hypothetical protein V3V33_14600 [Candidatus Lokiarchaeia archaeon]